MANYGRKLRTGAEIRRKERVEKIIDFVKRMKKLQEETEVVLRKV